AFAAVGALGVAFVSGTPYSRAASQGKHKELAAEPAPVVEAGAHVVDTFELRAVNTMETVTVRYVDGVIDPASKQQVDYVMRCYRTDGAVSIDPRLVD